MASQIESRPFGRVSSHASGRRFDLSQVSMARVLVAIAMLVFLAISLILLERRWAGAFRHSLTPAGFGLWLFLAGVFCVGLKWAVSATPPRLSQSASLSFGGIICGLLSLFTCAVFPQEWGWLLIVGALCWLGLVGWFSCSRSAVLLCQIAFANHVAPVLSEFFRSSSVRPAHKRSAGKPEPSVAAPHSQPVSAPETQALKLAEVPDGEDAGAFLKFATPELEVEDVEEDADNAEVQSQMIRRTEANGDDVLEAHTIALFMSGSKQTVLHVPFTPPFEFAPHVECEIADGSDVRLKVGAVFPYGARVELKRMGTDLGELEVAIDLFAIYAVSRDAT
jgi:hypothetical protein